jgi:hypothetical protein
MRHIRWYRAAVFAAVVCVEAVARADEQPGDGDGEFGPTNQLAEAVRNQVGQVLYWECAGKCSKGDTCCRPIIIHP